MTSSRQSGEHGTFGGDGMARRRVVGGRGNMRGPAIPGSHL